MHSKIRSNNQWDTIETQKQSRCPIAKIGKYTESIKELVLRNLWKPTIKHTNVLSNIQWKSIVNITNDIAVLLEDDNFDTIKNIKLILRSDKFSTWNNESESLYFSQLGSKILEHFVEYFPWDNKIHDDVIQMNNIQNEDMVNLLILALQSYDSLFTGLIQESNWDIEQYNKNTPKIRKIALELAAFPDLFQQYIIKDFSGNLNLKKSYESLPHDLKEKFSYNDYETMYPELILSDILQDWWRYGECPAKKDKTLIEVFKILNTLYWKVYISNTSQKK